MIGFVDRVVSIDPDRVVPLAGRGPSRIGQRRHDALEANILILHQDGDRAVVISVDALFVGRKLSDAIVETCVTAGVPQERILIVASHTHSAPAMEEDKPLLGEVDAAHVGRVTQNIVATLKDALAERPILATAAVGRVQLSASVNRRRPWLLPQYSRRDGLVFDRVVMAPNPAGPVDPMLTAIVLRGGARRTVIWHYACHPVSFPDSLAISAEYPGVVRTRLRSVFGANTAVLFLQGFAGDIRPPNGESAPSLGRLCRTVAQGPGLADMTLFAWQSWSQRVARAAERACHDAQPLKPGAIAGARSTVPLASLLQDAPAGRAIELQRLRILGEDIVAVSAEPLVALKEFCPRRALCVGYIGDVFGYWPRTSYLPAGGYEVNAFKKPFGVEYPWCPNPDAVFQMLLSKAALTP
jgi:hypothetical protein